MPSFQVIPASLILAIGLAGMVRLMTMVEMAERIERDIGGTGLLFNFVSFSPEYVT